MHKIIKIKLIIGVELLALAVVFAFLASNVDVRAVGPNGTVVGFGGLNKAVSDAIPYNDVFYTISQLLGYLACAIVGVFALMGLIQWIKRKKLLQVDADILALGVIFLSIFLIYVFFELHPLNYRPLIMPGEQAPESSFPSSHTMLAVVVFWSIAKIIKDYIPNPILARVISVVFVILSIVAIGSRLFSGVHWITDIIAGLLISLCLYQFFNAAIYAINQKAKASLIKTE